MTELVYPHTQHAAPPAQHQPSAEPTLLPYMPQLDGLRALAVVAVLLYHADVSWLPGGFLGVDLFFVLSGYLITALLVSEWQTHGSINLGRFWLRRTRRLLPALFLMIAATLTYALFRLPEEVARLRADSLVALGYSTNWYLIFKQESYFEAIGRPSLFQHLWSLAIEEQFYLLWPPVLVGLLQRFGRRGALMGALAGAVGSAAAMAWLYQPDADPSRVYYGTDTRAFAPLCGGALACIWSRANPPVRSCCLAVLVLDMAAFATLGGVVAAWMLLNEYQPWLYQGGFVMVTCLAAALIWALVHPAAIVSPRLLSCRPLNWLGTRSYALYLWHWPVFMVTRPELDLALTGWPVLALRLGATCILAELSFRYIEMPFRSGLLRQAWQRFAYARGLRRWQLGVQFAGTAILVIGFTSWLGVAVVQAPPPAQPPERQIEAVHDAPLPGASAALNRPMATTAPPTLLPRALPAPPAVTQPSAAAPVVAATAIEATPAPLVPTEAPPTPALRISAIGDSVMVGAAHQLYAVFGTITIDAAVSRQAKAAIEILRAQRDAGQLGDVVIVHIGTNGTFSPQHFDQIMEILAAVPRVVFVTVKVPRPWEASNNTAIVEGVKRYPNTVLADWYAASDGHPELFGNDGVHPRQAGAQLFAEIIAAAVYAH